MAHLSNVCETRTTDDIPHNSRFHFQKIKNTQDTFACPLQRRLCAAHQQLVELTLKYTFLNIIASFEKKRPESETAPKYTISRSVPMNEERTSLIYILCVCHTTPPPHHWRECRNQHAKRNGNRLVGGLNLVVPQSV